VRVAQASHQGRIRSVAAPDRASPVGTTAPARGAERAVARTAGHGGAREAVGVQASRAVCAVIREASEPASSAPASRQAGARLWEIDVARTFAIGLMVVYHIAYDVDLLAAEVALDLRRGGWLALQVTCGSMFLALVGISFWIAHQRGLSSGLRGAALWRRHARRGAEVLAGAALVTVVTRVALGPDDVVRFGILHLIALAMLVVLPLMVRLGAWNAAIGIAAVAIGVVVNDVGSDVPGALVLGFDPGYAGQDWYPLLPWAGASLVGVAIGAVLYPDGERGSGLRRRMGAPRGAARAGAPGRHALPIYLLHQPVLIVLTALGLVAVGAEVEVR
jgi:uncharacterized membrane protein